MLKYTVLLQKITTASKVLPKRKKTLVFILFVSINKWIKWEGFTSASSPIR